MTRPKRTPKDKNHHIIKQAFLDHHNKPLPIFIEDVADLGGTSLDLNVSVGALTFSVEIKNPETHWYYKEGEVERLRNPAGICVTIETVEQVDKWLTWVKWMNGRSIDPDYIPSHIKEIVGIRQDRIPKRLRDDT